jgi:hypothetical protein
MGGGALILDTSRPMPRLETTRGQLVAAVPADGLVTIRLVHAPCVVRRSTGVALANTVRTNSA